MLRAVFVCLLAITWSGVAIEFAIAQQAQKQPSDALKNAGFDIYHVKRSNGDTIHCYLSNSQEKLPLLVNIEGSGCRSAFRKRDGRVNGGMSGFLSSITDRSAHVLVIEKPGVALFDNGSRGSVKNASRTFLENYTLEYVTNSHVETIRAILKLPHVSAERVLIFGISDGGQLAAEVSANLPEATHVAPLACGGPTQMFDYVTFASRPREGDKPGDAQKRIDQVYLDWEKIQEDADSIDKFWDGHPYRRWSSFLASSTTDALLKTKAKIYVAHGTLDTAVPVESFDVLVSTLRSRGKKISAERLDGLDHNFRSETEIKTNGNESCDQLIFRILEWWKKP